MSDVLCAGPAGMYSGGAYSPGWRAACARGVGPLPAWWAVKLLVSPGRGLLPGAGRDAQEVQQHRLQGFAQFLVGQVDQVGQALRDEERGAAREPLGAGRVIAEDQGEATLAQCC